ncbi:MAG: drug/metabolite transporter (DMT)-like permease [Litorivivens sp.]|jgi:drug/metabolite transporter (DMT)-like permease
MIWLFLSILFSTGVFLSFKAFEHYEVKTFPAIMVNYGTAMAFGLWMLNGKINFEDAEEMPLFWPVLTLGLVFIGIFYLIALTAQNLGVSVASVSAKMSLAIPVIVFPLIDPDEPFGLLHVLGLLMALTGVFLASMKSDINLKNKKLLALPLFVLLGSGLIDFTLGYFSASTSHPSSTYLLTTLPFTSAFVVGIITIAIKAIVKKEWFGLKEVMGGMVLGIINFGSIFFLVKAVAESPFSRTFIFPINNMGIILGSSILSIILFRETLSSRNKWGIFICMLAIGVFYLGEVN